MTGATSHSLPHLSVFPLGDSAITAELSGLADEALNDKALAMQKWLLALGNHSLGPSGIADIIVAWHSVTVFYDPVAIRAADSGCPDGAFGCMQDLLGRSWKEAAVDLAGMSELIRVPVCYGGAMGPDLEWLAREKGLTGEECIRLHHERTYRVYMVGFLPGFPYLGVVDPLLQVPRKDIPSLVKAGSVGVTGRQTGIYPLDSPGGWRIIGRTPMILFNRSPEQPDPERSPDSEPPIRLKTGDRVQFYPITMEEFGLYSIKS